MVKELEQRTTFRPGESVDRPYGGKVSDAPFPQALYKLAVARGFKSQRSLAMALGKKATTVVRDWYTGKHIPLPEAFAKLVVLFQPYDEKLDALVSAYGEELGKGRGVRRVAKERTNITKPALVLDYNRSEAARKLGVTRERISQLCERFNLPPRLKKEDIEVLSRYFDETKAARDRAQQYHRKKKEIA